jgi:hypothetical protein
MAPALKWALPYLALIAIVVGAVNFFWFFAESTALGGDALAGYASGGHYYVASHGVTSEVSRSVWEWSRIHALSILLTHPIAMAGLAYLAFRFGFPAKMAGRVSAPATRERVATIRRSGAALATARTAGQLGGLRFGGPLLAVAVLPAGILIKPVFMAEHAILATEVRGLRARRGLFGRGVEIDHAGLDSASPLIVYRSADSGLVRAIDEVVSKARGASDLAGSPAALAEPEPAAGSTSGAPGPAAAATIVEPMPAPITVVLDLLGIATGVVLIGIGLTWAIPGLGPFGLFWTGMAILFTASNLRTLLAKRGRLARRLG